MPEEDQPHSAEHAEDPSEFDWSSADVAAYRKVTPKTVLRWANKKKSDPQYLHSLKIDGRRWFRKREVDERTRGLVESPSEDR